MSSPAELFVLEYNISSHFRSDSKRIVRLNNLFNRILENFSEDCDNLIEESKLSYKKPRSFRNIVEEVFENLAVEIELFDIITNGKYMKACMNDDTETCSQLVENIGDKPYLALIRYFHDMFKYKYA